MKLNISLDLDEIQAYEETVATAVKETIDSEIRAAIRKAIREAIAESLNVEKRKLEKITKNSLSKVIEAMQ